MNVQTQEQNLMKRGLFITKKVFTSHFVRYICSNAPHLMSESQEQLVH